MKTKMNRREFLNDICAAAVAAGAPARIWGARARHRRREDHVLHACHGRYDQPPFFVFWNARTGCHVNSPSGNMSIHRTKSYKSHGEKSTNAMVKSLQMPWSLLHL